MVTVMLDCFFICFFPLVAGVLEQNNGDVASKGLTYDE